VRWWLVAAWVVAAIVCGVALVHDGFYVFHYEVSFLDDVLGWRERVFGCFGYRDEIDNPDAMPTIRSGIPDSTQPRFARSGAALFGLACAAPLVGLLAFVWRRGSAGLRHVLLLLSALAPLAALEYYGIQVRTFYAEGAGETGPFQDFRLVVTMWPTPVTWVARAAWGILAVAASLSWWRSPKPRRATPVDPEVFA
jgi:hypothetical protein